MARTYDVPGAELMLLEELREYEKPCGRPGLESACRAALVWMERAAGNARMANQKDDVIRSLHQELEIAKRERDEARRSDEISNTHIEEIHAEINTARDEIARLRFANATLYTERNIAYTERDQARAAAQSAESRAALERTARCGPSAEQELNRLQGAYNTIARDLGKARAEVKALTAERDLVHRELEVHSHTTIEAEIRREKRFLDFPEEKTFAAAMRQLWFNLREAKKELVPLREEKARLSLLADAQAVEIHRLKAQIEGGEG